MEKCICFFETVRDVSLISNMTEKQLVFGGTSSSTIHCRGVANSLSDICLAIHKVIVDTDREKEIVSRRDRSIPSKIQRFVDSLAIFDARTSYTHTPFICPASLTCSGPCTDERWLPATATSPHVITVYHMCPIRKR